MQARTMSSVMLLSTAVVFAVTAAAQMPAPPRSRGAGRVPASQSSQPASSAAASSLAESSSATAQVGRTTASAVQATNVSARLTKSINSRHARVGDEVLARTTQKATLADGTALPKGSRLIGHINQVRAKSRRQRNGELGFCFDHAILRNGRQVPIHAVMESIAAPVPPSVSGDMMGQGNMGAGPATAGGGGMMQGGAPRSGGLLGGGGGGLVGAAAPMNGALRGTANGAGSLAGNMGSSLNAAGTGAIHSTAALGRNAADLNGGASGNSALAGRTFPVGNLAGVTFTNLNAASTAGRLATSTAANGSARASRGGAAGSAGAQNATLFTARGKNVELDGGSQMTMSVTPGSR